jgi:outer membrane protein OmpA-like peptidoglycan-associated protein
VFKIKKKSGWTWNTSAGVSGGFAFISAGAGMFALNSPDGRVFEFNYRTLGIGYGKGWPLNVSGSTQDTYSDGLLYVSDTFAGTELTSSDIQGLCLAQEVSAGVWAGTSVTAMLLGVPESSLPAEVLRNTGVVGAAAQVAVDHPTITRALLGGLGSLIFDEVREPLEKLLQSDAKGLLLIGGSNAGPQRQAGVSGSFGHVKFTKVRPVKPQPPSPASPPPKTYVLQLPADVLFEFDKSDLKLEAGVALKDIEREIRARKPGHVHVRGHTDSIGNETYNMELSRRRAQSVASWLLARNAVTASKVVTLGFGSAKPVAYNRRRDGSDNPQGRALNRRVDIWLLSD